MGRKWKLFFQRPIYEREIGGLTNLIILLEKQKTSNLSNQQLWALHLSGISLTVWSSITKRYFLQKCKKLQKNKSYLLRFSYFFLSKSPRQTLTKGNPTKFCVFLLGFSHWRLLRANPRSYLDGVHKKPNTLWSKVPPSQSRSASKEMMLDSLLSLRTQGANWRRNIRIIKLPL